MYFLYLCICFILCFISLSIVKCPLIYLHSCLYSPYINLLVLLFFPLSAIIFFYLPNHFIYSSTFKSPLPHLHSYLYSSSINILFNLSFFFLFCEHFSTYHHFIHIFTDRRPLPHPHSYTSSLKTNLLYLPTWNIFLPSMRIFSTPYLLPIRSSIFLALPSSCPDDPLSRGI